MKFKIIDLCEVFFDHKYIVFLVFDFQAEFAQNKNNIDLTSYQFMTKSIRFFFGVGAGKEVGARRMPPVCTQPCIRLSRVLGMLTSELGNVTETVT